MHIFDSAVQTMDHPVVVLWRKAGAPSDRERQWMRLERHTCGGKQRTVLDGDVRPMVPGDTGICTVDALAHEAFAIGCEPETLEAGVKDGHRAAYVAFLNGKGLTAGETGMLRRGVYPLEVTSNNTEALGIQDVDLRMAEQILVLGWNEDQQRANLDAMADEYAG